MPLPEHEDREQYRSGHEPADDERIGPASLRLLGEREHRCREAECGQKRTDEVEPPLRPAPAFVRCDRQPDQRERDEHERHVDREDPAPRGHVEDPAAGQRPDHGRDPAPGRPRADRRSPFLLVGVGDRDQSQRRGCQQRARGTLKRASGNEQLDRRRERAEQRRGAEADDPDRKDPPLAVEVTERPADQDQRAEREQVRVHDPLLARETAAEIRFDRRQRDVHHRRIEQRDPRAEDRRHERQRPRPAGIHPRTMLR
jgi:hypothetical protein